MKCGKGLPLEQRDVMYRLKNVGKSQISIRVYQSQCDGDECGLTVVYNSGDYAMRLVYVERVDRVVQLVYGADSP